MALNCDINELDQIAYELQKKLFAQIMEGIGLPVTSSQVYVLNHIRHQGESMMTDIANYLGVTLGAVTSVVDRLHDFGLVSRERSEADRRLVMVKLSGAGEELLKKIGIRRSQVLNNHLKALEPEEIHQLSAIMGKLVAKILHS